ncbi:SPOR domain-containing protein [Sphingomicrobium marinum]|uniref:SPOR domain-containing protein n=1 Tax=Sphingomicrobium marinum TaxID=1227950 RepID=UPI00223EC96D|nr:SPOR domain-containing protein [Sphingomicrobium marinum]
MHKMTFPYLAGAALAALLPATTFTVPAAAVTQQQSAPDALKEALQVLASNPRDFDALLKAGQASVTLGDLQAAGGFFGRAADLRPDDPRPQAGMGAAMAQAGEAERALAYFAAAEERGGTPTQFGVDRGLAYDLQGNLKAAEAEYRASLGRERDADARRRLALNLAMQGERTAAIAFLQPLLNQGDSGAQRSRAFVLALTGDLDGARRAIDYAMPGTGDQIDPFLRMLPSLGSAQKAAAVHLGRFPTSADRSNAPTPTSPPQRTETRVAEATPTPPPAPRRSAPTRAPQRTAERSDPPAQTSSTPPRRVFKQVTIERPTPHGIDRRYELVEITDAGKPEEPGNSRDSLAPRPSVSERTAASRQAEEPGFSLPSVDTARESRVDRVDLPPAAEPALEAEAGAEETRLASIDETLSKLPPPAPRPKYEAPPAPKPKFETAPPQRAAAPDIGVAGTHWVQLAGGRQDAMSYEWRRLRRAANGALDGQKGHVTQGVDFFRLLVGPFDNRAQAQEMVNKLRAQGVDSFTWQRNPARLKIEEL